MPSDMLTFQVEVTQGPNSRTVYVQFWNKSDFHQIVKKFKDEYHDGLCDEIGLIIGDDHFVAEALAWSLFHGDRTKVTSMKVLQPASNIPPNEKWEDHDGGLWRSCIHPPFEQNVLPEI